MNNDKLSFQVDATGFNPTEKMTAERPLDCLISSDSLVLNTQNHTEPVFQALPCLQRDYSDVIPQIPLPNQTVVPCSSVFPMAISFHGVANGIDDPVSTYYRNSDYHEQFSIMTTNVGTDKLSARSGCSKELPLSTDANLSSPLIFESSYMHVVRDILSDFASYSLSTMEDNYSSNFSIPSGFGEGHTCSNGRPQVQIMRSLPKREKEARKAKLLALLQLVDDQYSRTTDEIHTVVSAFDAATELDPCVHAQFALKTISFLYRRLRVKISEQIITLGEQLKNGNPSENGSSHSSIVRKQQTTSDHPLWKPQRGLPEISVSVLRAWMFQNFLHPYPKDAEKHVLAVKSGLTRSQVSNWFINARVRLWKPMIEEMYSELNRRNECEDDGADESCNDHGRVRHEKHIVDKEEAIHATGPSTS